MSERDGKLVAADKSTIATKPLLDAIVVEGAQSDGCLPDPTYTNESDRCEAVYEANDLLDQLIPPK